MDPIECNAYRFDIFEARIRTGFLLREDKRVKIEELPFQMLLVLLETPGQVVTKKELRDRLWAGKTFGELDSSLHVAVAKLREALGESAAAPRLIETVRRRGYQFVGKVVPELQRRGVFRHDYEGRTLREHLGLSRPENRYVAPALTPPVAKRA